MGHVTSKYGDHIRDLMGNCLRYVKKTKKLQDNSAQSVLCKIDSLHIYHQ